MESWKYKDWVIMIALNKQERLMDTTNKEKYDYRLFIKQTHQTFSALLPYLE